MSLLPCFNPIIGAAVFPQSIKEAGFLSPGYTAAGYNSSMIRTWIVMVWFCWDWEQLLPRSH
jgi:hypothetical protein